jgi:transposase
MYLNLIGEGPSIDGRRKKIGSPNSCTLNEYLDMIKYVMRTGIQWRELEGPLHWTTYHKKYTKWSKMEVFSNCYKIVLKILRRHGYLKKEDLENLYIDTSMVKNRQGSSREVGINHYDRGRNGNKLSVVVTSSGIPLSLQITNSNVHDIHVAEAGITDICMKVVGSRLIADKGYNSQALKTKMATHSVRLIYPMKRNQLIRNTEEEKSLLKTRNIIENFWAWMQNNRHLVQRYDKKLRNYKEFYYLGMIELISKKVSI